MAVLGTHNGSHVIRRSIICLAAGLQGESKITAATAANMHETAVRLGSDDIIYSQAIEPTRHPVDNSALITIDDSESCHACMGEALLHLPVQHVF